ncbi:MAG: hypothetical protein J7642_03270 [Cyanobacteria bacterium SBC]|nr:hypothetical protein [Cyanobacteria bacterium SBC]
MKTFLKLTSVALLAISSQAFLAEIAQSASIAGSGAALSSPEISEYDPNIPPSGDPPPSPGSGSRCRP